MTRIVQKVAGGGGGRRRWRVKGDKEMEGEREREGEAAPRDGGWRARYKSVIEV